MLIRKANFSFFAWDLGKRIVKRSEIGSILWNMFRILCLLLLIPLWTQCRSLDAVVQYPDPQVKSLGFSKIAVLLFDIEEAKWGDEFTDAFSLQLAKQLPVKVLEREQLSKVISEQSFSKTGIIDAQTAVRIGKVLGVDALAFGRGTALKKFDERGKLVPNLLDTVSIKIVHIESGQVVLNLRKKPGTDWTPGKVLKYVLGLGLVWSQDDILIESSQYDFVAEGLLRQIHEELRK